MQYVQICPYEISGFGAIEVRRLPGSQLLITEVFLLDQEVTHDHTKLSSEDLASFLMSVDASDIDPATFRVWWHSHANLSVFFSGVDEDTISSFDYLPWLISIVVNHRGEVLARLDVFASDSVPVQVTQYAELTVLPDFELIAELRQEIKRRVKKSKPIVPPIEVPAELTLVVPNGTPS